MLTENKKNTDIKLNIDENYNGASPKTQLSHYGKSVYNYNKKDEFEHNKCEDIIIFLSWVLVTVIPLFWFTIWRTVTEYEKALIFRLGRLNGKGMGPGLFVINPLLDSIIVVDLRVKSYELPPQSMMTKDSVTCKVDAIVFMKVEDPMRAILEVEHYQKAFLNFAKTTLRCVIGQFSLEDILSKRDIVNQQLRDIIQAETSNWGVIVPNVEIKDVSLPANMQRAMAAEAEAERERKAKVIASAGEAQAAQNLADAANIVSASPGALQLRYLHTLVKISAEKNSTILFPLPMEIMRGIKSFSESAQILKKQLPQIKEQNNNDI